MNPSARAALAILTSLGAVLVAVVLGVVLLAGGEAPRARAPIQDAAADVDPGTPVSQPSALGSGADLASWASSVARRTGVPARALAAYGAAEIAQRLDTPRCGLSWATIAGIGRIESDHGRIGGDDLTPGSDGVPRPPIVGIPLDGTRGTREILDTDAGRLDGDTVYDRAVGPMQFLPSTWARYGRDGNGDGVSDPHQIDDAARATAAYLCAEDRQVATGRGWWDGVLTYNASSDYARLVWAAADRYATTTGP